MYEGILAIISHPNILVFGLGPDRIIDYFEGFRSTLLDAYFSPTSMIDSTHNIIIDTILQY